MTEEHTGRNYHVVLRWVARIWSIPAIFFMFAHFLEPETGAGVDEDLLTWITLGLLFVSVFGLVLAWWKAGPGAWMAIIALALSMLLYWVDNGEFFPLEGFGLFLLGIAVPAGLFLWSVGKRQPTKMAA